MRRVTYVVVILLVVSIFSQISISFSPVMEKRSDFPPMEPKNSPVTFTNVADSVGFSGIGGTFFSWGDYDNDEDQDLLVNGNRLYRNNHIETGTADFTDVSSAAGISGGSGKGNWADYDNDGCLDFYANILWRNNCDGTFTDVTVAAGDVRLPTGWAYGAAGWGDYDRDGYMDLYVTGAESGSTYYPDLLWHNNGNGTFTELSAFAFGNGVTWIEAMFPKYGRGVAWGDYNNDGWLDIYITNYRQQLNYLWQNDQDGTFTDLAMVKGVQNGFQDLINNPDPCNEPGHGVGSSWGDYDNDGDLDLYVANLNHKDSRTSDDSLLYRNNGPASGYSFTNVRGEAGMHIKPWMWDWGDTFQCDSGTMGWAPEGDELIMEGVWGDFDNDGWLDLFTPQIYAFSIASHTYLYHNNQNGTFTDVAVSAGVREVYGTYGGAWADFDNDGDMDLVTGGCDTPSELMSCTAPILIHLFRNNMYDPGGNELNSSWLKVDLDGCGSNTCGIGARVNVTNGTLTQIREVEGGTGAHSQQNSMVLNFGFGDYYGNVDITVRWPSGVVQTLIGESLNQTLVIVEDECTGPVPNPMALFEGPGNDDLNVTWTLSPDDGAGFDNVANYAIYYSNNSYDRNGMLYSFLAEVPKGVNYYVDVGKGIGNNDDHFYLIKANSTLGYQTWENQAAKVSRFLTQGLNLVSIPIESYDDDILVVLQTLNYDVAWWYDSSDPLDHWKSYNPSKSNNDLLKINSTMGIWVDVTVDGYLTIAGTVPKLTSIGLKAGWNLIGYPSFIDRTVENALANIPYERIEGFEAMAIDELKLLSGTDTMTAGFGYWLKVGTDTTLTIM